MLRMFSVVVFVAFVFVSLFVAAAVPIVDAALFVAVPLDTMVASVFPLPSAPVLL